MTLAETCRYELPAVLTRVTIPFVQTSRKTKPAMEDGIYTTGQMFIFGTGGDMEHGTTDFANMFYNPIWQTANGKNTSLVD